jgi:[NiFe] hydrogenase assembly HybE family chaperone
MTGSVDGDLRLDEGAGAGRGGAAVACVATLRPDPAPMLTAAFRAAAARMEGLAFVNPALEVEAVGFARWQGHWLGVMVTPWFMNLTLAPADPAAWQPLALGAKRRYRFPAGDYEFIGAHDATLGDYQVCSLFSPMERFEDHAAARVVAQLARDALFDPANAEIAALPGADPAPADAAEAPPGPLAQLEATFEAPLSKREFLRGRFLPGDRDDRR